MQYEGTVFVLIGPSSCGVITHRHGDVCSPPLSQLCLPIDVYGHHCFQHYFLDWLIIKETGDLAWSDQEFELVPLSIVQCLRGSTNSNFISTTRLYQYKETFREVPSFVRAKHIFVQALNQSWTKFDVKSIVNVSNLQLKLPFALAVLCVYVFDLINSAWSLNASQMVSDREGIKTRTPSFIHHNLFYEKAQTLQREERENRAAIVSLGRSHRRLFQMTNHRLLPRATSNQIKHVKTQTEHNYNALLQSLGVY